MSALISRTDDIICMLDVNMIVEKLRAMLKFFETDRQTDTQTDRHTDRHTDTQTFSKRSNPISGKYFKTFYSKKNFFIQKYPEMDRPNLRCLLQLC